MLRWSHGPVLLLVGRGASFSGRGLQIGVFGELEDVGPVLLMVHQALFDERL